MPTPPGFSGVDPPVPVSPNDRVRTSDINRVIGAVLALLADRGRVYEGIRAGAGGVDVVRAATLADRVLLGRISAIVPPAAEGEASWPSETRYFARAIEPQSMELGGQDGVLPAYGREVRGDEAKVYPAAVGSLCLIVRTPDPESAGGVRAQLWVLDEVVARRRCTGGG